MADAGRKRSLVEGKARSVGEKIRDYIRRFLRRASSPAGRSLANVTVPRRSGPKGRSGGAVAEIEDDLYRSFPPRK